MITREQVQDLQPGDVVEAKHRDWSEGSMLRGPVAEYGGTLRLCGYNIQDVTKSPAWSWVVVSRAPRPLYVNHPRTEPVPGDVVRDADRADSVVSWSRAVGSLGNHGWRYTGSANHWHSSMPARLRLLVDGETGQVVP